MLSPSVMRQFCESAPYSVCVLPNLLCFITGSNLNTLEIRNRRFKSVLPTKFNITQHKSLIRMFAVHFVILYLMFYFGVRIKHEQILSARVSQTLQNADAYGLRII